MIELTSGVATKKNSDRIAIASGNAAGSARSRRPKRRPQRASAASNNRCTTQ
jgi:hypothetical protein